MNSAINAGRRRLLGATGLALGVAALGLTGTGRLLAQAGAPRGRHPGFGPLYPTLDRLTGLPLLALPAGFSYTTFGWAGEPMHSGEPTPAAHDGMGVVAQQGDVLTLVRNHELGEGYGHFVAAGVYDAPCAGGAVRLRYDLARDRLLGTEPALSGTLKNCSGGATPWGSWLSCEEYVCAAGEITLSGATRELKQPHGFIFEVPASGVVTAEPLTAMGQFRHEAAAIDPASGIVYLTEDHEPAAGFYRFLPKRPGELHRGGRLQMLQAVGRRDLRRGCQVGERLAVRWVEVEHPEQGLSDGGRDIAGVREQGEAGGGSLFTRLEGCIAGRDAIHFTATDGGDARCGQVWAYHPQREELVLIYESCDPAVLDYPDNVVLSPRGGLVVCQDSEGDSQRLYGLSADGGLFEFARNAVRLQGEQGFYGDFRDSEWAGACFSPDGRTLFANVYEPGFSVAITGPWRTGLI